MGLPRQLMSRIVRRERQGLFERFYKLMTPGRHASLLDVGGPTRGFDRVAERFGRVIAVNVERPWDQDAMAESETDSEIVLGDARRLPFGDGTFDYVFSNATLEHIRRDDWPDVASQIARVAGRGFFIATPNYWFPFEPHYVLPAFQWVPEGVKRFLLLRLGLKIGFMSRANYHVISLPRRKQLERLFGGAKADSWGTIVPRHLVVWKKSDGL